MIQLGIVHVKILEEVPASSVSFPASQSWIHETSKMTFLEEDVVNYWLTDKHWLVKGVARPQCRISEVCCADELLLRILPGSHLDQMNSSGLGAAKTYLAKSPPLFSSASIQLTNSSQTYVRVKVSLLPTFNSP